MGKRSTTAEFIAKAKTVHGNDTFQYHAVEYRRAITKVTIYCPEHGPFQQTPNAHLNGNGCALCGRIRESKRRVKGFDEFLAKATVVHQGRYRYIPSSFAGSCKTVLIECPLHGSF